jgi:hypothetical protein
VSTTENIPDSVDAAAVEGASEGQLRDLILGPDPAVRDKANEVSRGRDPFEGKKADEIREAIMAAPDSTDIRTGLSSGDDEPERDVAEEREAHKDRVFAEAVRQMERRDAEIAQRDSEIAGRNADAWHEYAVGLLEEDDDQASAEAGEALFRQVGASDPRFQDFLNTWGEIDPVAAQMFGTYLADKLEFEMIHAQGAQEAAKNQAVVDQNVAINEAAEQAIAKYPGIEELPELVEVVEGLAPSLDAASSPEEAAHVAESIARGALELRRAREQSERVAEFKRAFWDEVPFSIAEGIHLSGMEPNYQNRVPYDPVPTPDFRVGRSAPESVSRAQADVVREHLVKSLTTDPLRESFLEELKRNEKNPGPVQGAARKRRR